MAKDFRETLYTVDQHGNRKWVYSDLVRGRFFPARAVVAYTLMAFYLLMPWITIRGKQGIYFDIFNRKFIFFGAEFWATDTYFLFLIFISMAFALFFFTALFGRVWCGWACPETVFLEFLFRPIERLIEGGPTKRMRLDRQAWNTEKILKKFLKHGICAALAWGIASTALAYFIGRELLLQMMSDWPMNNPVPFTMTLAMMGLMGFQFGWFREQFCTLLCPYARFQSVLMDSQSIVVGYDEVRGEPRGKVRKKAAESDTGDCVDCGLCVRVCPTGIDIRNGLQLECVACTACIDACDSIMHKVGRPEGLIRYDTEDRLLGRTSVRKILRLRPFVYAALLLISVGALSFLLATRKHSEFQALRGAIDTPYSMLDEAHVSNHLHIRVANKSRLVGAYRFRVSEREIKLVTPLIPLVVEPGEIKTTPLFLNFPKELLKGGKHDSIVIIEDETGFSAKQKITLLGPGK